MRGSKLPCFFKFKATLIKWIVFGSDMVEVVILGKKKKKRPTDFAKLIFKCLY